MEFMILIFIGIGISFFVYGLVRVPGTITNKKFVELGILKGKTYNEICSHVGQPNSISAKEDGKVCQWINSGYHIALIFNEEDICQGVIHENKV